VLKHGPVKKEPNKMTAISRGEYFPRIHLTVKSSNRKVGPIPVSTTAADTCPPACPLRNGGCYAKGGPLAIHWNRLTASAIDKAKESWRGFLGTIAALPSRQLWRHNQAGDLPGQGNRIHGKRMRELVAANSGKGGFTYTHKPVTGDGQSRRINRELIAESNANGFTVNLSANHAGEVDELVALNVAPVVVVMPIDFAGTTTTPAGNKIVQCPATRADKETSCDKCQLCAKGNRSCVVGFPAHGASKRKADSIANQ